MSSGATALDLSQIRTDSTLYAASFLSMVGVYSSDEVDQLLSNISLSTSTATDITGLLKGDGTHVSPAVAGTDYVSPVGIASGTITPKSGDVDFSTLGIADSLITKTGGDITIHSNRYTTIGGTRLLFPPELSGGVNNIEYVLGNRDFAFIQFGSGRFIQGGTVDCRMAVSTGGTRKTLELVSEFIDNTTATRKSQVTENVFDYGGPRSVARSFANGANGYKAIKVISTDPPSADMQNGEVIFYTDGSGNLAIKLKDSGGTVRTGSVTLT